MMRAWQALFPKVTRFSSNNGLWRLLFYFFFPVAAGWIESSFLTFCRIMTVFVGKMFGFSSGYLLVLFLESANQAPFDTVFRMDMRRMCIRMRF